MAVFRSLQPNDGRRHGVRQVLLGTLPGFVVQVAFFALMVKLAPALVML